MQCEAKITIESKTKLTEDEINKLKEDAEKYADADKNKKEQVEIKNEAESFIYTTEKLIGGDLKDKISQKQGIDLTDLIKELREAMTANNNDAMKEKLEDTKKDIACDTCKATGCAPGTSKRSCSTCGGAGQVRQTRRMGPASFVTVAPCRQCRGEGDDRDAV